MNLILHIVLKDFLFLRGRLAVWGAVMAAKVALGFWFVLWGDVPGRALPNLQGGVAGLIIFDAALTLLLAALLVQEDGVVGTPAFWRTRPIAGGRLLAAKISGAFLLLVVPAVLVAVPWWLWCGFGPGQIAMAALEVGLFQIGLLFVAFTAASVTNSLARCLVWGVLGGVVVIYLGGWWSSVLAKASGAEGGPALAFVSVLLMLPVAVTVVVWQYLTRRAAGGVAMLIAGGVLAPVAAFGLMSRFAGNTISGDLQPGREEPALTRDIGLEWKSARASERAIGARKSGYLEFNYEMNGVPAGHVVSGWLASVQVRGNDGGPTLHLRSGVAADNFPRVIPAVLEIAPRPGGTTAARTLKVRSVWSLPPETLAQVRQGDVSMHGTLSFQVARPIIAVEMPLRPGSWQADKGRGARVIRLEKTGNTMQAQVLEASPLAALTQFRWGLGRPKLPGVAYAYYALVKWPGRTAEPARSDPPYATMVLGGVELRRSSIEIRGAALLEPAELAAGRLQVVDLSGWTLFHRDVKVEGVAVE
jgi:hypothetical protein